MCRSLECGQSGLRIEDKQPDALWRGRDVDIPRLRSMLEPLSPTSEEWTTAVKTVTVRPYDHTSLVGSPSFHRVSAAGWEG